jgi:hypothetical protein
VLEGGFPVTVVLWNSVGLEEREVRRVFRLSWKGLLAVVVLLVEQFLWRKTGVSSAFVLPKFVKLIIIMEIKRNTTTGFGQAMDIASYFFALGIYSVYMVCLCSLSSF